MIKGARIADLLRTGRTISDSRRMERLEQQLEFTEDNQERPLGSRIQDLIMCGVQNGGADLRPRRALPPSVLYLHVVVEEELIWMRAQAQGVMLLALCRNPHIQEVFVKTSPLSRNSWSFSRQSSASPRLPATFGTFFSSQAGAHKCFCPGARRDRSC